MNITCIIIEDEPLALEKLKGFIEKLPFLQLIEVFENALDAMVFLKSNNIQLIFLDIHLDEFSGIQFLETNTIQSQVIITTAYQEYALQGYELQISDYLLKPFSFNRFIQAIDKVQQTLTPKESLHTKNYIFIKTENRLEKVCFEDLLFIEGMRDYRKVHTRQKRIMTLQTFTDFEKIIPENILCRVHKSYMVAIDKIDSIEKDKIKIDQVEIPISETYKQAFLKLIH